MSGIGLFVSTDEPIKLNVRWDLCCPLVMDSLTPFHFGKYMHLPFLQNGGCSFASVYSCDLSGRVLPPDSSHQPQGAKQEDTSDYQDMPWWLDDFEFGLG